MGVISVNLKKIKMKTQVKNLVNLIYQGEGNVPLSVKPENYDQIRTERYNEVNHLRATKRPNKSLYKVDLTEFNRQIANSRTLRDDTVDTIAIIVQPSLEYLETLTKDEQIRLFSDAFDVLVSLPEWFGWVEIGVIRFDKNTPFLHCLASTINMERLSSDASRIFGNKSRMSERQTVFADAVRAKGWDVERGEKRVN